MPTKGQTVSVVLWRFVRLAAPWYVAIAVLGASQSYSLAVTILALSWLLNSPLGRSTTPDVGQETGSVGTSGDYFNT